MQLSDDDSTSITKLREGKEKKGKWLARRVGLLLSRWRYSIVEAIPYLLYGTV